MQNAVPEGEGAMAAVLGMTIKEVENELVRALKESGPGTYNGEEHYVVISDVERKTLDIKAARKKLSRQFIQAHTKVTNCLSLQLFGYSKKEAA